VRASHLHTEPVKAIVENHLHIASVEVQGSVAQEYSTDPVAIVILIRTS